MSSAWAQARSGTASTRTSSSHGPSRARANAIAPPTFPTPTIPAFMVRSIQGIWESISTRSRVSDSARRLPREELVHDAVRFSPFRALLEDADPSDLGHVLQMRAAAGAVVRVADLDDSQAPDGLWDELEQGSVFDLVMDNHTILFEDPDILRRGDDPVALVFDPLQIGGREVRGLEVHAAVVHVDLIPNGPRGVPPEDESGHEMLGGVYAHVLVPPIPVDDAVHRVRTRHPIHVVLDDALLLRDPKDPSLAVGPSKAPGVIGLPAPLRIEEGLIEDDEIRTAFDDPRVELPRVTRVRILSPALLHVEYARGHRAAKAMVA